MQLEIGVVVVSTLSKYPLMRSQQTELVIMKSEGYEVDTRPRHLEDTFIGVACECFIQVWSFLRYCCCNML